MYEHWSPFQSVTIMGAILMIRGEKMKKFNSSLKTKMISGFIVIILLMGLLSIAPFIALQESMDKMNTMVDTTIMANEVVDAADNTSTIIEKYMTDKKPAQKEAILKNLSLMKKDVDTLKKNVKDKEGRDSLGSIDGIVSTYTDNINNTIKENEANNYSGAMNTKDAAGETIVAMKSGVNEFISSELKYYKVLKNQVTGESLRAKLIIVAVTLIIGVISIIAAALFSGNIANAIYDIATSAKKISEGDLNIKTIRVKSKDDIFILADSFNKMCLNLRQVIQNIIESSSRVASSADTLRVSVDQNKNAIELVAASMETVSGGAEQQSEECEKTVDAVNKLYLGNKKIQQNAEKILVTSKNATEAAAKGYEKMSGLLSQINVIQEDIVETDASTRFLRTRTDEIQTILEAIRGVSSKTNMLALNASIEAERAGEYGKGFSVVAQEIRKLSKESERSTREITEKLKDIQDNSIRVSENMLKGVEEIKQGTVLAKEAKGSFNKIVSTSQEVEIEIKGITEEIYDMVEEIKRVEGMSKNIYVISKASSCGSNDAAEAIVEQMASLEEISSYAEILTKMAGDLEGISNKFKL